MFANWDAHDMADVSYTAVVDKKETRELLIYNNSSDKKVWIVEEKERGKRGAGVEESDQEHLNNLLCIPMVRRRDKDTKLRCV